ncbi:MAG: DUF4287 domain-containing protein [Planctomycetes bacterium]|nr:DUF4287 domain-containing protein [Planctomycetota bacterium]
MATADQMLQSMIANLAEKSGKTLPEWVKIARGSGKAKHGEIVKFLKETHELGHGYANLIAQEALKADGAAEPSGDALIDAQYAGKKAALRPLCDALIAAAKALGSDVEVAPKKTSVSLRRKKQFALIEAATATRIDLGLQLKGVAVAGRLEKYKSTMCSHLVRLETPAQLDAELKRWLRQAYEAAG